MASQKMTKKRIIFIYVVIAVGLEIFMYLVSRLANPFGARIIYAGMWSVPFFLLASLIEGGRIREIIAVGSGLIIFAGVGIAFLTLLASIDGEPPSAQYHKEELQRRFADKILSEIKPLVRSVRENNIPDRPGQIRKKALALCDDADDDRTTNGQSFLLPGSYEPATYKDTEFTVFFISKWKTRHIGGYGLFKTPAYNARFDIYCILWPEKIIVAKHSIFSEPPPKRVASSETQLGSPSEIMDWIAGFPLEGKEETNK